MPQIFFPKPSDIYKWTIFPKIVVLVAHRETSGGTLRRGESKERVLGGLQKMQENVPLLASWPGDLNLHFIVFITVVTIQ